MRYYLYSIFFMLNYLCLIIYAYYLCFIIYAYYLCLLFMLNYFLQHVRFILSHTRFFVFLLQHQSRRFGL